MDGGIQPAAPTSVSLVLRQALMQRFLDSVALAKEQILAANLGADSRSVR